MPHHPGDLAAHVELADAVRVVLLAQFVTIRLLVGLGRLIRLDQAEETHDKYWHNALSHGWPLVWVMPL